MMANNTRKLEKVFKHIEQYNREMGAVQTDMKWVKEEIKTISKSMARKGDLTMLKWAIGINGALIVGLIGAVMIL